MIPLSSRDVDELQQQTKKEESVPNNNGTSKLGNNNNKTVLMSGSSSRQWSALRNPRIVRVSRSFGGKDRHSKVCTVRGLRDRRIRLSVPTAIQLYDLQERLGLSMPSKVIDWLMDSTKHDIDMLPPLQLPQGSFGQFLQQSIIGGGVAASSSSSSHNDPLFFDGNYSASLFSSKDITGLSTDDGGYSSSSRSRYWDYLDAVSKARRKEVERDNELLNQQADHKVSLNMEMNNKVHGLDHYFQGLRSAQNFFPVVARSDHSTYNNYLYNQNWDELQNRGITSSSTILHQRSNNTDDHNHNSTTSSMMAAASSCSTFGAPLINPSGGPQVLFFSPPPSTSTFFPATTATTRYPNSYNSGTTSIEAAAADTREIHSSNFHNLFSPISSIKTFQLNNASPNKLILQHRRDEDKSRS